MTDTPSHAFDALVDAADALHRLGLPALAITFGAEEVTLRGTDRFGSHRDPKEWITTAHGQLGLVHHLDAVLGAARLFQATVRANTNLNALLGQGRLDLLWKGTQRIFAWYPDGHVDRTIHHSAWPSKGNGRQVRAALRAAERVTTGTVESFARFDPSARTLIGECSARRAVIAALSPFLDAQDKGRTALVGRDRLNLHSADVAQRANALQSQSVPHALTAAYGDLVAALCAAPAAITHALVEDTGPDGPVLHLRTGKERMTWAPGTTPLPQEGATAWATHLFAAWHLFWGSLENGRPAMAHRSPAAPRRLSLIQNSDGQQFWMDLFGACRVQNTGDLAALMDTGTGPVWIVSTYPTRPVASLPARTAMDAAAVVWALAGPGRAHAAQTTVWTDC